MYHVYIWISQLTVDLTLMPLSCHIDKNTWEQNHQAVDEKNTWNHDHQAVDVLVCGQVGAFGKKIKKMCIMHIL